MMQPESGSRFIPCQMEIYIPHFPLGLELYFILLLSPFALPAAPRFFFFSFLLVQRFVLRINYVYGKNRALFILPYCYLIYSYAGKSK